MKAFLILIASFLFSAISICAQTQVTIVKTNGDTIYCDKITAGGKNIICESGGEKTKLKANEVSYYIEPYTWYIRDGDPPPTKDTTRKCFVDKNGLIHEVEIENDKYYLTTSTKKMSGNQFSKTENTHIMNKQHEEIAVVAFDKSLPDLLLKYFGGSCPEFDTKVRSVKPKFNNKIFPTQLFAELLALYNSSCK